MDGITSRIDGLEKVQAFQLDYTSLINGWHKTRGTKLYANAQRQRWMTEGASEGSQWAPLKESAYSKMKPIKFEGYPGKGRRLMVASSHLLASVLPAEERGSWATLDSTKQGDFNQLIVGGRMTITTTVVYANVRDEDRNFSSWSSGTIEAMKMDMAKYIARATKNVTSVD